MLSYILRRLDVIQLLFVGLYLFTLLNNCLEMPVLVYFLFLFYWKQGNECTMDSVPLLPDSYLRCI